MQIHWVVTLLDVLQHLVRVALAAQTRRRLRGIGDALQRCIRKSGEARCDRARADMRAARERLSIGSHGANR